MTENLTSTSVLEIRDRSIHVFEYINENGVSEITPADQIIEIDSAEVSPKVVDENFMNLEQNTKIWTSKNKLGHAKSNTRCLICKKRKIDGVILHFFPKTELLKTIWAKLCRIKIVKPYMKLCSDHFTKEQYDHDCKLLDPFIIS